MRLEFRGPKAKAAGRFWVCLSRNRPRDPGICWLHLLPRPTFRWWGLQEDQYDGIQLFSFGLGPLAIIGWSDDGN